MREIQFGERGEPCVFLLGYFDAVHIGHRMLIGRAKTLAGELGVKTAAMTFYDAKQGAQIYVYKERISILADLGIDYVVASHFEGAFKDTDGRDFLGAVAKNCDVKAFVCGEDFRFGKGALCGGQELKEYCAQNGIRAEVLPLVMCGGEKVSATLAKKYLSEGNIPALNRMLQDNYFLTGKVETEGRHVGRGLGFPTANIHPSPEKYPLKEGVYAVRVCLDGRIYRGIANYGPRPTFGDGRVVCETYIDGFSGDLYGKEICVRFDFYIRGVRKFSSPAELESQLKKDLEKIR